MCVCAVMASSTTATSPAHAKRLGRGSLTMSVVGIIVTLIIVVVVLAV